VKTDLGIFSHFGFNLPLEERLSLISESGFAHVFTYFDDAETLTQDNNHINAYLGRTFNLSLDSIHSSYDDANFVWSNEEKDRQKILKYYKDCLDFCSKHGIPNLVIHPIKTDTPPPFSQVGLGLFLDVTSHAEARGVRVALENTRTNEHVDTLLGKIDSKSLGLCYDTSHDNLYGDPPLSLLNKWLDRLLVLHLSDNLGEKDDHMLPGKGSFDWGAFTQVLRKVKNGGCPLMLEAFPERDYNDPRVFLQEAFDKLSELRKMVG
jgi:sugar phosphate isomerase/epimerase